MKKEMSQDRVFNIRDNIFDELTDTEVMSQELHNRINPVLIESECLIVKDTNDKINKDLVSAKYMKDDSKVSINLKIVLKRIVELKIFLNDIQNKIIL